MSDVRAVLEQWSDFVPDGMVEAVDRLIAEAVTGERERIEAVLREELTAVTAFVVIEEIRAGEEG